LSGAPAMPGDETTSCAEATAQAKVITNTITVHFFILQPSCAPPKRGEFLPSSNQSVIFFKLIAGSQRGRFSFR